MPSKSEELVDDIRRILTEGFYIIDPDGAEVIEDEVARQRALDSTKPWRNELWVALNKLERVACPMRTLAKDKKNGR